jgi:hypothetical protein
VPHTELRRPAFDKGRTPVPVLASREIEESY